jgi:hypothetical protein
MPSSPPTPGLPLVNDTNLAIVAGPGEADLAWLWVLLLLLLLCCFMVAFFKLRSRRSASKLEKLFDEIGEDLEAPPALTDEFVPPPRASLVEPVAQAPPPRRSSAAPPAKPPEPPPPTTDYGRVFEPDMPIMPEVAQARFSQPDRKQIARPTGKKRVVSPQPATSAGSVEEVKSKFRWDVDVGKYFWGGGGASGAMNVSWGKSGGTASTPIVVKNTVTVEDLAGGAAVPDAASPDRRCSVSDSGASRRESLSVLSGEAGSSGRRGNAPALTTIPSASLVYGQLEEDDAVVSADV